MTTISADISDRLALSRQRMRESLQGRPAHRSGDAADARTHAHASGASLPWLASLKSLPFASVFIDAVSGWWSQHPLRIAVVVGSTAAKALAQPIAERNPLGLVLGTALVGAVVVWSRPWRWLLKPALFAGLLPQLLTKALAHLPTPSLAPAPPRVGQASVQPSSNGSNNT